MASAFETLLKLPHKFRFDAAVRLLSAASGTKEPHGKITFNAATLLSQPAAEVTSVRAADGGKKARMTTPLIGLIGPSGTMPRWYTELVAQAARIRSHAIGDFFDLLAQRFIAAFAESATKYRLHRASEEAAQAGTPEKIGGGLLALTGYAGPDIVERFAAGPDILRHYAGFFSSRPRSADRLASMVSDYLGRRVEIVEFAGAWLIISPDQQSRLPRGRVPGIYNALGRDAAIGTRAWDQQARFIVRIGPLNREKFEALLPDRRNLRALVSLIRAYAGWEVDFAINLIIAVSEIPSLQLSGDTVPDPPRLGWTTWLPAGSDRLTGRKIADEPLFGASLVEAWRP